MIPQVERIDALIQETERWLEAYRLNGRKSAIEALGCQIRIRALRDAKDAIVND